MISQLRPLSLGEILDRTAALYRTHFLLFAGIAAVFSGAMLLTQMLHLAVLELLGYPHIAPRLEWAYGVSAVLQIFVVLLVAGLAIAANNRAVAWVYLGQAATIRGAVASIAPRLTRYIWLMTVTVFRAWAPLAVLYVALFAILFSVLPHGWLSDPSVLQHPHARNPAALVAAVLGVLVLAPLLLLAVIYGAWMSLRYALATPACVVEDARTSVAIKRSIALSEGSRGRIFVLALLVLAVQMLLGILMGLPFLLFTVKHAGHAIPIGMLALQQLGNFITNTLIGPIYGIGLTLFYYDQRIRKEGFDIEWMMQAAGLTAETTLPVPEQM